MLAKVGTTVWLRWTIMMMNKKSEGGEWYRGWEVRVGDKHRHVIAPTFYVLLHLLLLMLPLLLPTIATDTTTSIICYCYHYYYYFHYY